ncbi:MAG: HAD family hydrolase [Acidobacteriota bacterium]|nr:HAD family hydrolase [Acidobacteriota bacterium]
MLTESGSKARRWDQYDAYLFDIDGTLLHCGDAVHYFAFCDAVSRIVGRPCNLDGVTAHGNTDVGILRDALRLADVPEGQWRPLLTEIRSQMCRFVEQRATDLCVTVLPAARNVLNHLRSQGAVLGVATGNLERIGRLKLRRCGLLDFFDFGGYSDPFEYRRDVFRGALEQARIIAGADAEVCVIGDTPEDVRSAKVNGLDVIAVATGIYSFDELQAERPHWCLSSLAELIDDSA